MGNYPDEERCHVWNTDAYTELADYLKKTRKINKMEEIGCHFKFEKNNW
ncbi:MAG: hypothetical protein L6V91_07235 [Bacilli bacterium]|nr:MAG: hypothetical protein L6V91_07235 [Bacilli bacterium]